MGPPTQYEHAQVAEAPEEDDNGRAFVRMVCARLAGRAIVRVIARIEDAQENSQLDLSECQLMQVPDAVYHLMRNTELKTCDLSGNTISKLPPKFAVNFSLITDLNLSNNQIGRLPDELTSLANLQWLDISNNTFIRLPHIPSLKIVLAHHNQIIEVDVERLKHSRALEEVDLQNNPIPPVIFNQLSALKKPKVLLTEREIEDWEDLNV